MGRQKKGMQMIRGKLTRGTPLVGVWRKKRPASAGAKRKRQQTQTAEEADASSYSPGLGSAVGHRHVRMAIAAFFVQVLGGRPPKVLWNDGPDGTIACIRKNLKFFSCSYQKVRRVLVNVVSWMVRKGGALRGGRAARRVSARRAIGERG